MKVYPARDIRPFVMYCVNGKPRSSLLIESTDSMICRLFIGKTLRLHADDGDEHNVLETYSELAQ